VASSERLRQDYNLIDPGFVRTKKRGTIIENRKVQQAPRHPPLKKELYVRLYAY